MSERTKHHWLSNWGLGTEARESVPFRYLLMALLLVGACLILAGASRSPWMVDHPARLDVRWRLDRDGYTYRLNGRYSISSLRGGFATSLSNEADPGATASSVSVPTGLYRVTLEPGYTLERFAAEAADGVEVVPASLVSPNPVVVMAKDGRIAPLGLSLVAMPATAVEPEATCMNGS
jgi:hypothetical protein